MRKILLSALVIISFIAYAVVVRPKNTVQNPVITPNTIGKKIAVPTVTPIPTDTPTPFNKEIQPTNSALQPTDTPPPTATPQPQGQFKDGSYTGSVADAFYGSLQVQVTISGGKISNVQFLQAPHDQGESMQINNQADPMLAQEAIQAQSAQVDSVSGATQTSQAFVESMKSALSQAKS